MTTAQNIKAVQILKQTHTQCLHCKVWVLPIEIDQLTTSHVPYNTTDYCYLQCPNCEQCWYEDEHGVLLDKYGNVLNFDISDYQSIPKTQYQLATYYAGLMLQGKKPHGNYRHHTH